jgi:hypothetical protein
MIREIRNSLTSHGPPTENAASCACHALGERFFRGSMDNNALDFYHSSNMTTFARSKD